MDSGAQAGLENRSFLWGKNLFWGKINKGENLACVRTSICGPKNVEKVLLSKIYLPLKFGYFK